MRYGEALERVLTDLLLDWQGGRAFSEGWDQLLRETNAGQEWREALMRVMEDANPAQDDPVARLVQRGRDIAGRGESWCLAAVSRGIFQNAPGFVRGTDELNLIKTDAERAGVERSSLKKAIG